MTAKREQLWLSAVLVTEVAQVPRHRLPVVAPSAAQAVRQVSEVNLAHRSREADAKLSSVLRPPEPFWVATAAQRVRGRARFKAGASLSTGLCRFRARAERGSLS